MASKTIELRKVVTKLLKEVNKQVYYESATDKATYPYIVYNFDTVNLDNYPRDDIFLTIDVWDQGENSTKIETLADNIESALNMENKPSDKVLPTFYLDDRRSISDEDETIRRRQLKFTIQNYYIGG